MNAVEPKCKTFLLKWKESMTNFLTKITTWWQPPKKRTSFQLNKAQSTEKLAVNLSTQKNPVNTPTPPNQSFNSQPYRQLIGKLAKIAIATQRERQRRKDE